MHLPDDGRKVELLLAEMKGNAGEVLRQAAKLAAGKKVNVTFLEVWGGYSTTIGNMAFEAPDACASATEIARRGLAASGGQKDVLPRFDGGWLADGGRICRCPLKSVRGRNSIRESKRRRLAIAVRIRRQGLRFLMSAGKGKSRPFAS